MSADDTLTLEPTPIPAASRDAAAALKKHEDAARQQSLRSAYLRAVAEEAEARAAANRLLTRGVLLLLIGLVVTLVTYSQASAGGGMYVVAWGPVVFGLIQIVRGLSSRP